MQGAWIEIFPSLPCSLLQESLPVQGAWIEIVPAGGCSRRLGSLPVQGAWIEINGGGSMGAVAVKSLPVQGAWIEIISQIYLTLLGLVAPRAGSVD